MSRHNQSPNPRQRVKKIQKENAQAEEQVIHSQREFSTKGFCCETITISKYVENALRI